MFLILTGANSYFVFRTHAPAAGWFAEVFFVQNYRYGVWDHTWTLAVEEHFYNFLPIILGFSAKLSSDRKTHFRAIPSRFRAITVLCMALRAVSVYFGVPNYHMADSVSHDRMHALFFGVLIGYYNQFMRQVFQELLRPTAKRIAITLCSVALLPTAYFLPRYSRVFSTLEFTCVYLGCGGMLLLSLYVPGILQGGIARLLELVGTAAA